MLNVANFSVSGALTPDGHVLPQIMFNTPQLGGWLDAVASCQVESVQYGVTATLVPASSSDISWPTPTLRLPRGRQVQAWVPLALNDVLTTSLPIIVIEFDFKEGQVRFTCTPHSVKNVSIHLFSCLDGWTFHPARSPIESSGRFTVAVVVWHPNLYASNFYSSPTEMMNRLNWAELRRKTFAFESHLPKVDPEHRILLNMEIVPAFALTRVIKTGEILTMGYCELNQRDSFWTSFVHLVLFREAEQKMIQESCDAQLPSGKIPTTILPYIEREWDIDITAYFVLRIARHFRYYQDSSFAKRWFQPARRAIGYLASLRDKQGAPFARDFWADWKDVRGLNGRYYGPHFVLITKAAVKEFNWMANQLGEEAANVEINAEPMWNGSFYQDVMSDGSADGRFHQDQLVAGLWNVVDEDRYEIMMATAVSHENEFGLPETVPFYPDSFGYRQGEYHNGGIWPWLTFADAAGRIGRGFSDSGQQLLLKVAETDIRRFGDYCSNEFLHGKTGVGGGHSQQGWNACAILPFSLLSDEPRNDLARYVRAIKE
jgi:hypothetical protein